MLVATRGDWVEGGGGQGIDGRGQVAGVLAKKQKLVRKSVT